ncbi:MAG: aminotransferase class V-fold PLP-dependent enzyme [Proteobacteria bacterium]|nr:aminotransferase class V-fold PLP-dependent enzyme [Pseudomonadota bacterium]
MSTENASHPVASTAASSGDAAAETAADGVAHRNDASPLGAPFEDVRTREPDLAEIEAFVREHPGYAAAPILDEMRVTEFARLDASGAVYLDYTGSGLYAQSQVDAHGAMLGRDVYGNPHSVSPSAQASTAHLERAREAVLRFFNASPETYAVIFTANATAALRLIGEHYPFGPERGYIFTQDNHNSVCGISAFAERAGAATTVIAPTVPDLRLDHEQVCAALGPVSDARKGLFAYPAQSNFSGVKHSLDLIDEAQRRGHDVLLDAAAFAPTNRLDLAAHQPEFVCISFYKMFGYPTGLGCLLIKQTALASWRQRWFAGGNVKLASVLGQGFVRGAGAAAFEDGTVDFLSIPAVEMGLAFLEGASHAHIAVRVQALTDYTLRHMRSLVHASGLPLIRLLGPIDTIDRGATIAFTVVDSQGQVHDIRKLAILAGQHGISVRTGFFCNPGAGEAAFGLSADDLVPFFRQSEFTFDDLRAHYRAHHGFDIGAIRASYGLASNFHDAWRFVAFLRGLVDRTCRDLATWPGDAPDESPVCSG